MVIALSSDTNDQNRGTEIKGNTLAWLKTMLHKQINRSIVALCTGYKINIFSWKQKSDPRNSKIALEISI